MDSLPNELLISIAHLLPFSELPTYALLNRRCYEVAAELLYDRYYAPYWQDWNLTEVWWSPVKKKRHFPSFQTRSAYVRNLAISCTAADISALGPSGISFTEAQLEGNPNAYVEARFDRLLNAFDPFINVKFLEIRRLADSCTTGMAFKIFLVRICDKMVALKRLKLFIDIRTWGHDPLPEPAAETAAASIEDAEKPKDTTEDLPSAVESLSIEADKEDKEAEKKKEEEKEKEKDKASKAPVARIKSLKIKLESSSYSTYEMSPEEQLLYTNGISHLMHALSSVPRSLRDITRVSLDAQIRKDGPWCKEHPIPERLTFPYLQSLWKPSIMIPHGKVEFRIPLHPKNEAKVRRLLLWNKNGWVDFMCYETLAKSLGPLKNVKKIYLRYIASSEATAEKLLREFNVGMVHFEKFKPALEVVDLRITLNDHCGEISREKIHSFLPEPY